MVHWVRSMFGLALSLQFANEGTPTTVQSNIIGTARDSWMNLVLTATRLRISNE